MNEEITYRVFELNQKIKGILETSFPEAIWVKGEISSFDRQAKERNIYFQLQEKDKIHDRLLASIDCFLGEWAKPRLRQRLVEGGVVKQLKGGMDGLEVRLKVRISVYAPGGRYRLTVEDIDPAFTLGQIEKNRKRIIDYLEKSGLLEKNREETFLPVVVQRIGLITRERSQAYFDFLKKLENSQLSFTILFHQATVQGQRLAPEILKAINYFQNHLEEIDALAIIRGGGSRSDLSWFDNQELAEVIANFPKPVFTGIGHKKDISIADLVAYEAASTPSSLADFLVSRNEDFLRKVEKIGRELKLSSTHLLASQKQFIYHLQSAFQAEAQKNIQMTSQKLQFLKEETRTTSFRILKEKKEILLGIKEKAINFSQSILERNWNKIKNYQENLSFLDPSNVLKRGFSLTTINGKIVKSIKEIKVGDIIWTHLQKGKIKSQVKDAKKEKQI
jgi:exodeoxyribonuclease VII large subunit